MWSSKAYKTGWESLKLWKKKKQKNTTLKVSESLCGFSFCIFYFDYIAAWFENKEGDHPKWVVLQSGGSGSSGSRWVQASISLVVSRSSVLSEESLAFQSCVDQNTDVIKVFSKLKMPVSFKHLAAVLRQPLEPCSRQFHCPSGIFCCPSLLCQHSLFWWLLVPVQTSASTMLHINIRKYLGQIRDRTDLQVVQSL